MEAVQEVQRYIYLQKSYTDTRGRDEERIGTCCPATQGGGERDMKMQGTGETYKSCNTLRQRVTFGNRGFEFLLSYHPNFVS